MPESGRRDRKQGMMQGGLIFQIAMSFLGRFESGIIEHFAASRNGVKTWKGALRSSWYRLQTAKTRGKSGLGFGLFLGAAGSRCGQLFIINSPVTTGRRQELLINGTDDRPMDSSAGPPLCLIHHTCRIILTAHGTGRNGSTKTKTMPTLSLLVDSSTGRRGCPGFIELGIWTEVQ